MHVKGYCCHVQKHIMGEYNTKVKVGTATKFYAKHMERQPENDLTSEFHFQNDILRGKMRPYVAS
jgi:hypothetical protein